MNDSYGAIPARYLSLLFTEIITHGLPCGRGGEMKISQESIRGAGFLQIGIRVPLPMAIIKKTNNYTPIGSPLKTSLVSKRTSIPGD